MKKETYYIDANGIDRTEQLELAVEASFEELKDDPHFYAELVSDLMFHWIYGTEETPLMKMARENHKVNFDKK